jgi:hypothetical protein
MRKLLPTLLLLAVCLGGFWYASSQGMFKQKAQDAPKQLLNLKSSDIQTVRLTDGTNPVELNRKGETWEMAKPQPLPTDKYGAGDWTDAFAQLTYDAKIEDNPADLAEYGLDKPAREFEAVMKDGSSKKLLVGKPLPVAGSSYAKLADAPAVYSVSDQTLQTLEKQPLDFMDKAPIHIDYDKVKSVTVDWKGAKWQLDKKDFDKKAYEANWKLGAKDLKPEEGSAILDLLTGLQTDRLVKPAADVKADQPELRIEAVQDSASLVFTGKIENDVVWLTQQGGQWAYAVPAAKIQELADKGK